jgi:hypothetical protein
MDSAFDIMIKEMNEARELRIKITETQAETAKRLEDLFAFYEPLSRKALHFSNAAIKEIIKEMGKILNIHDDIRQVIEFIEQNKDEEFKAYCLGRPEGRELERESALLRLSELKAERKTA